MTILIIVSVLSIISLIIFGINIYHIVRINKRKTVITNKHKDLIITKETLSSLSIYDPRYYSRLNNWGYFTLFIFLFINFWFFNTTLVFLMVLNLYVFINDSVKKIIRDDTLGNLELLQVITSNFISTHPELWTVLKGVNGVIILSNHQRSQTYLYITHGLDHSEAFTIEQILTKYNL